MPYSEENNLLFIHIPKNAGKSVEVALGICSEAEVVSYRFRSLLNRAATYLQRKTKDTKVSSRLFGTLDYTLCTQHLTLVEIEVLGLLTPEQFHSCHKVAIVRNPWARAVSSYRHFSGRDAPVSGFAAFLKQWLKDPPGDHNVRAHKRQQTDFLRDSKGTIEGVELLRFESLEDELSQFCSRHGIPYEPLKAVGGMAKDGGWYRRYFDENSKQLVESSYPHDIVMLGYKF